MMRSADTCSKRADSESEMQEVLVTVEIGESLYSSTCPESTQEQAESLRPSRRGVDVAVGTPGISDQNLCKSSQASVVPIRIHRWTETSDLFEDLQDIAEVEGECPVPFAQGLLWPVNEGSGITASHSGQVYEIQQRASSSGNESPDAAKILHQTSCCSRRVSRMAPKRSGDTSMAKGLEKCPKSVDSLDIKRQKKRERMRMRRANMSPGAKAREAERKRKERAAASPDTKAREAERKRQQRVAASPGTKAREAERKRQQRVAASPGAKAREVERRRRQRAAASPGTKAREAERKRRQRAAASPGAKAREVEFVPVPAELAGANHQVVQRCPRGDRAMLVGTGTILGKEGSSPSVARSTRIAYSCSYCLREFREIRDLTNHVGMCPWLQPQKCPLCSNVCSNWISMRDHIAMHVEELGTKCPLCERAFAGRNSDVLRHVMQHLTFKPFLCSVCKSTFLNGYDIAAHVCQRASQRGRWAFPLRTTSQVQHQMYSGSSTVPIAPFCYNRISLRLAAHNQVQLAPTAPEFTSPLVCTASDRLWSKNILGLATNSTRATP